MIDRARFASSLASLAAVLPMFGRTFTRQLQEIYWHALADLSDEDFEAACTRALRECTQFPSPAELLERAPARPKSDLELLAARTFQLILRHPKRNDSGTLYWREQDLAERYGRAAGEAFVIAGATGGFRAAMDPERERFIRRDFIAAFIRLAKDDPAALEPVEAQPQLPTGVQSILDATRRKLSPPATVLSFADADQRKAAWRDAAEKEKPLG